MDLTEAHDWKCNKDEKVHRSIVENKRVFKFLMRSYKSLDDVCSRVLSNKPMRTLRAAFSEVRLEKSRGTVMMGSMSNISVASDSSALALHRQILSTADDSSRLNGQNSNNMKGTPITPSRPAGRLMVNLWIEIMKRRSGRLSYPFQKNSK